MGGDILGRCIIVSLVSTFLIGRWIGEVGKGRKDSFDE